MRDRRVLGALGAAYAVALAVLVAGPWGWALNRLTVALYAALRYDWPIAPDWAGPEHYGILLNVLLFVPVGALLVLVTRWPWWVAVATAALASGLIETGQWLWLTREGGVSDLVANTVGAGFGAALVSPLARPGWRRAGRPASPRRR